MGTVHKPNRNSFDLVIVVDDIDAIKVWSEQIECALAGIKPKYHVARSGISHLDRNRIRFKATKKLLLLLDTKHRTFGSQMMSQWIEHFRRRGPKDVMCLLVDSSSNGSDSCSSDTVNNGMSIVKTDDIANFHNWWPTMVEFLFLKTKAAPNVLNYSLETVHSHEDDQLPRRLTQCFNAFVDPEMTRANTKCQTVKVVGGAGEENPQKRENMHVVIASLGVDRSVYDQCNSVHTRADVLRCVLFILVDSGIVPSRRFSRKKLLRQTCQSPHACASHVVTKIRNTGPVMFLLSSLVFVVNLPAALLVFCYAFVPLVPFFGCFMSAHLAVEPDNPWLIIATDVFFLAPFVVVGSLGLTDIININLATTSIIFCFFLLHFTYFTGWVTICHYYLNKTLDCEYGVWSLPEYLWSTDYKLPNRCVFFYLPVLLTHLSFLVVLFLCMASTITICEFCDSTVGGFIFQTLFNKHVLATEPIIIAIVLLGLGYSPYIIVLAGIVGCIYFVSVTSLKLWRKEMLK